MEVVRRRLHRGGCGAALAGAWDILWQVGGPFGGLAEVGEFGGYVGADAGVPPMRVNLTSGLLISLQKIGRSVQCLRLHAFGSAISAGRDTTGK